MNLDDDEDDDDEDGNVDEDEDEDEDENNVDVNEKSSWDAEEHLHSSSYPLMVPDSWPGNDGSALTTGHLATFQPSRGLGQLRSGALR